jgi:hypothetical protein
MRIFLQIPHPHATFSSILKVYHFVIQSPDHPILCTCTGICHQKIATNADVAAQAKRARIRLTRAATPSIMTGTALMLQVHRLFSGSFSGSAFYLYLHPLGTIAGSINQATHPSLFRHNGVAGATSVGSNARGAQLYFQVCLGLINASC